MKSTLQIEKLSTRDTLRNMYFNVFINLYNSEDYFVQKKIVKKRITKLFENLKLDEINISPIKQEISELITLEKEIKNDSYLLKDYAKENFTFRRSDNSFFIFLIPSLLISFLFIFIHPLLYIISYCLILCIMGLFTRRIHNKIRASYIINILVDQLKEREIDIKKTKLKNAILSCIFFNTKLQIVDDKLQKIQYSYTTEIEVQQNQFVIELVGLIRTGKINILDQQTKIAKSISDQFRLQNQTEINSDSFYKEFNKYYKMNEKEFGNLYQDVLFQSN